MTVSRQHFSILSVARSSEGSMHSEKSKMPKRYQISHYFVHFLVFRRKKYKTTRVSTVSNSEKTRVISIQNTFGINFAIISYLNLKPSIYHIVVQYRILSTIARSFRIGSMMRYDFFSLNKKVFLFQILRRNHYFFKKKLYDIFMRKQTRGR